VIEAFHSYVRTLCFLHLLFQQMPNQVQLVLEFLARGYIAPAGLALGLLVYWFEGKTTSAHRANQLTVLRALLAALLAGGMAALSGSAWRQGLSDPELLQTFSDWPCWQGPPSISVAAAAGFALAATLWQRNWRWGLGLLLTTGLWVGARVCCGHNYPLDVVFGTVLGPSLAWLLGYAYWLDRPLEAVIRFARRLTMA